MSGRIEAKLKELGITLPSVPTPVANYVPFVRSGSLVFLSGQGPRQPEGGFFSGKVGSTVSIEQGYQHARLVGLQLIAVLRVAAGGELDRVRRIVKVLGMVNADPEFGEHPRVINGCSDLFVEVFGEKGRHARSAIGVGSLPHQMTVEIEAIAELD
ncbi:MAG: RidA family protein [Acidobacteriia bacterium]|nr:RidA family protein [Methyloceanibacter sp.]MCL6490849.1 RidA family protein [Terriglobia bacterium]